MKMLDHVNSNGHRDMVKILTKMYRDLMVNKDITAENIKQAQLLGWCMEIMSLLPIFSKISW